MKKFSKSTLLAAVSVICTLVATAVATSACMWFAHQPEEPASLSDL